MGVAKTVPRRQRSLRGCLSVNKPLVFARQCRIIVPIPRRAQTNAVVTKHDITVRGRQKAQRKCVPGRANRSQRACTQYLEIEVFSCEIFRTEPETLVAIVAVIRMSGTALPPRLELHDYWLPLSEANSCSAIFNKFL